MMTVSVLLYVLCLFLMFQYKYSTRWTFVAAPALGPLATAVFFAVRPLNPYRNIYAQIEGKQETLIMRDPAAQRLVALLGSRQARLFVLKAGLLNSLILVSVAAVIVLFLPKPFPSTLKVREEVLIESAFLFSMPSMALQGTLLFQWAFRNWKGNAR